MFALTVLFALCICVTSVCIYHLTLVHVVIYQRTAGSLLTYHRTASSLSDILNLLSVQRQPVTDTASVTDTLVVLIIVMMLR